MLFFMLAQFQFGFSKLTVKAGSQSMSEVSYSLASLNCMWCLSSFILKSALISLCCGYCTALINFCSQSVNTDFVKDSSSGSVSVGAECLLI